MKLVNFSNWHKGLQRSSSSLDSVSSGVVKSDLKLAGSFSFLPPSHTSPSTFLVLFFFVFFSSFHARSTVFALIYIIYSPLRTTFFQTLTMEFPWVTASEH